MARRQPEKTDWEQLRRASLAADRAEFLRTTPGRRVEWQIELSRELTALAARRRRSP